MKKIIIFFFVFYFSLLIYAEKKYTIAVIPKGNINQFWKEVKAGAINAERAYDIDVIYRGPVIEANYNLQIRVIKNFIAMGVDAIVLAPSHKDRVLPVIELAKKKGIKVVIIDSEISGNYHDAFIATDNYLAGRRAGEEFVKLIKHYKAGIMRQRKGNASTDKREQGFIDVLTENNIEIVVDEYGGAVFGDSLKKFEEIIASNPEVKGYFCPGEISTLAFMRALENTGQANKKILLGFDYNQEIQDGIDKGIISGVITQRAKEMGFLGVKTAFDLLEGKEIEKQISIEVDYINY
jgi:ribose transport system substrate-binding protein